MCIIALKSISKKMSRGLDNCNPGNIRRSKVRYKGEVTPSRDPQFKEFESVAWGYRAMFVLLDTYRRRYGLHTIRTMISRWAPPSENHTDAYIRFISERVGITPDDDISTLDEQTMTALVAAMSQVENGVCADRRQVNEGWRLFRAEK